jgi:DNA-binding transcriptional LysR family regulator
MDLRQLVALVALADHGTFSSAARALFTVQSNVSTHVSKLERDLGVTLFDRSRGTLTEEGVVVVARARRIQGELEAIIADLDSLGAPAAGEIRLGVIGSTARWLVPGLLEALRVEHPRVRATVVEASTTSLLPQLVTGLLELAIVNLPVDDPEIATDALFSEDLICVTPRWHPLAERSHVTLAELAEHPMLLAARGTALRDEIEHELARSGIRLQAQAEIDGVRLLASLAFQGYGAAILPATAVPAWLEGDWNRVRLDGLPRRQVGLARRAKGLLSAPARALTAIVPSVVALQGANQPGLHDLVGPGDTAP